MIKELQREINKLADPKRVEGYQRFFKTGKGKYGEGDIFIGLTNPICHSLVKKYKSLVLREVEKLLHSKIHEERLIALLILVYQFSRGDGKQKKTIYDLYLANTKYINNWDLVDLSAHKIVGDYLLQGATLQNIKTLVSLAKSDNLWERRIAIISTFAFINNGDPKPTLEIAKILLHDKHDLIHKAVGWALREVGKKCGQEIEMEFLDENVSTMPRTMLRYSIEKFDEKTRQDYLQIKNKY
jgi:3-methyladenine DNA glycosylase AlkD